MQRCFPAQLRAFCAPRLLTRGVARLFTNTLHPTSRSRQPVVFSSEGAGVLHARGGAETASWSEDAELYLASQQQTAPEDETRVLRETTQLIRKFGRSGDAIAAVQALADLGKAGIQPDLVAVTITIGACVDCNDLPRAIRVFEEIVAGGVVAPDEMLFSVLLRAYGRRQPPNWGEVSTLLLRMRKDFGITPRIITYNTLLEVCADNNDYERGCQLINRMEEEGVVPDQGTASAVSKRRSLRTYLRRLL